MQILSINNNVINNNNVHFVNNKRNNKVTDNNCCQNSGINISPQLSLIYFCGNKKKTAPFFKRTVDTLDRTYDKYYESQMITEKEDIHNAVEEIMAETGESEETVLSAMAQVTQFANFRSIPKIGEYLDAEKVSDVGAICKLFVQKNFNYRFDPIYQRYIADDTAFTDSLNYFLEKELISPLKCGSDRNKMYAVFLDDDQIKKFENLKKESPEMYEFIKDNPSIKFFILSGFENGVTFANRNKDLKSATMDVVLKAQQSNSTPEDVVDADIIKRANDLGITPIIIRNVPPQTEEGIYESMKPEMMSRDELFYIVDQNAKVRGHEKESSSAVTKDITAQYLENNLEVFSPERMSACLSGLHDRIVSYAKSQGKTEDDIYYVIPNGVPGHVHCAIKSYHFVNYAYQKVNDIPADKFVKSVDTFLERYLSDKILVNLDDCAITGNSTMNANNSINAADDNLIFAYIYGTNEAKETVKSLTDRPLFVAVKEKCERKTPSVGERTLKKSIGDFGYSDGAYSCIFPYMSPDNNCELGASIALLHNVNFRTQNPENRELISDDTIKNNSQEITNIADIEKAPDKNVRNSIRIVKDAAREDYTKNNPEKSTGVSKDSDEVNLPDTDTTKEMPSSSNIIWKYYHKFF